jgi:hypothetical protein
MQIQLSFLFLQNTPLQLGILNSKFSSPHPEALNYKGLRPIAHEVARDVK